MKPILLNLQKPVLFYQYCEMAKRELFKVKQMDQNGENGKWDRFKFLTTPKRSISFPT